MNLKKELKEIQTALNSADIEGTYTPGGKILDIQAVVASTDTISTTEAAEPITATYVLVDKVGYVNGAKVTGTCTFNANTTDADAVEADVALGKTFYSASGVKLTGTAV